MNNLLYCPIYSEQEGTTFIKHGISIFYFEHFLKQLFLNKKLFKLIEKKYEDIVLFEKQIKEQFSEDGIYLFFEEEIKDYYKTSNYRMLIKSISQLYSKSKKSKKSKKASKRNKLTLKRKKSNKSRRIPMINVRGGANNTNSTLSIFSDMGWKGMTLLLILFLYLIIQVQDRFKDINIIELKRNETINVVKVVDNIKKYTVIVKYNNSEFKYSTFIENVCYNQLNSNIESERYRPLRDKVIKIYNKPSEHDSRMPNTKTDGTQAYTDDEVLVPVTYNYRGEDFTLELPIKYPSRSELQNNEKSLDVEYIVLEYGGDYKPLKEVIHDEITVRTIPMSDSSLSNKFRNIINNILNISALLNTKYHFYHGDLHTENVLVKFDNEDIKFFDFDFSGFIGGANVNMAEAAQAVSWPPPASPPDKIKFNLAVYQLYLLVIDEIYKNLSRNDKREVRQEEIQIRNWVTNLQGSFHPTEFYKAKQYFFVFDVLKLIIFTFREIALNADYNKWSYDRIIRFSDNVFKGVINCNGVDIDLEQVYNYIKTITNNFRDIVDNLHTGIDINRTYINLFSMKQLMIQLKLN